MPHLVTRHLVPSVLAALNDTPAVFLQGARQSGKSTLVRALHEHGHDADYVTFDDAASLAAAEHDPAGFIGGRTGRVVLDEVQRVPSLFMAIKRAIDLDRTPGRFLMTGSANALVVPTLAEALVGRVEFLTLWPLSQGELTNRVETFVDRAFGAGGGKRPSARSAHSSPVAPAWRSAQPVAWRELLDRVVVGGYPEAVERVEPRRRGAWFQSYVTTILQRDVRDLAVIERLGEIPQILRALAARCGRLLNYSELARDLALPQTTLKRYIALLEATFLVQFLPAWSVNIGKRLVKSPKSILTDTGLLCTQLGVDTDRLLDDSTLAGHVLENFVAMELRKQSAWSATMPSLHHFRSHGREEIDLVLEDQRGRIVAIEVKASSRIGADDFATMRSLADALGDRFVSGVVLHTGSDIVPFGRNLHAVPVSTLWS